VYLEFKPYLKPKTVAVQLVDKVEKGWGSTTYYYRRGNTEDQGFADLSLTVFGGGSYWGMDDQGDRIRYLNYGARLEKLLLLSKNPMILLDSFTVGAEVGARSFARPHSAWQHPEFYFSVILGMAAVPGVSW
jgi:hypothetical protein